MCTMIDVLSILHVVHGNLEELFEDWVVTIVVVFVLLEETLEWGGHFGD